MVNRTIDGFGGVDFDVFKKKDEESMVKMYLFLKK